MKAIRDMDNLAHIHCGDLFRMAWSGYFCSVRYHHGPAKRGILLRQKLFTYVVCVVASAFTDAQVGNTAGVRFGFENETGYAIEAVYVVPVAGNDWGPDLLNHRDQLLNGQRTSIRFAGDPAAELFDVKVRFLGDGGWSWTKSQAINLRSVIRVRVRAAQEGHRS